MMPPALEAFVSGKPVLDQSPRWAPNRRASQIAAGVVLALVAGGGLALILTLPRTGDDAEARWMGLVFVAIAPWMAGSTWLLRVRRLDSGLDQVAVVPPEEAKAATGHDGVAQPGLGFRYSRALTRAGVGLFAVFGLFFAVIAVAFGRAFVEKHDASALALLAFVAVIWLGPTAEILRRAILRGVLILTPDGVIHRSWAVDSWCSWDDVLAVEPVRLGFNRDLRVRVRRGDRRTKRRRSWLVPELENRHLPDLLINAGYLPVHPELVIGTVRFYAENADRRVELGTQVAVDRVRRVVRPPT